MHPNSMWPLAFRYGSWDQKIWESVRENNEYGISERFHGWVIDIGAHIGAFSSFADSFGAIRIIAIEPDPANCQLLAFNLKHLLDSRKLIICNQAISSVDNIKFSKVRDTWPNTGGALYSKDPLGSISGISIDTLLSSNTNNIPVLLKVDCEGMEFEALKASHLKNVVAIVGEYHGYVDSLKNDLLEKGFKFTSHKTSHNLGLFGASRLIPVNT